MSDDTLELLDRIRALEQRLDANGIVEKPKKGPFIPFIPCVEWDTKQNAWAVGVKQRINDCNTQWLVKNMVINDATLEQITDAFAHIAERLIYRLERKGEEGK
jgi:hypothetical protein